MSTDDFTEHIGDHGLAGGGGVEYSIRGREDPARANGSTRRGGVVGSVQFTVTEDEWRRLNQDSGGSG